MKPNGRRRWRKWAKRWRRGQTLAKADAILRRAKSIPLPSLSGAVAKKAKRSLPPPATRPFDPRSLVGMSQRRRKQLFHQLFDTQTDPETIYSGTWSQGGLRIGERLRPCPGCCGCKSKPAIKRALKRAGHSVYASLLKHGQAWICGKLIITIATNSINQIHTGRNHCDGSGILSAKRSK